MDVRLRRPSVPSPAVKLLAADLLSLSFRPPYFFHPRSSLAVVRAETLGVVVSRERREKYVKFLVDDGTGCAPCILWLNQRGQPWLLERAGAVDVELRAEMAEEQAEAVQLGRLMGVRGRVTEYGGKVQLTVGDVWEERDPNAQVLHWLDCVRLARCFQSMPMPMCDDPQPQSREPQVRGRKRKGPSFG